MIIYFKRCEIYSVYHFETSGLLMSLRTMKFFGLRSYTKVAYNHSLEAQDRV